MKYKHIFLVWFFAEIILAIAAFFVLLAQSIYSAGSFNRDYGMLLLVVGLSLLWSSPSLIVLLGFNYFYTKKHPYQKSYFKIYSVLIIAINIVYALCSRFIFSMNVEFLLYFIFTTIAGLLALYFICLKIKKKERSEILA